MHGHGYRKLLDVGCGLSSDVFLFASEGFDVTAVDFSEVGINKMRTEAEKRNLKINFVVKRIEELGFGENSFGVIYSHLSLHFFDSDTTKKIFDRLHNVLKTGGRIFIKVKSKKDAYYGKGKKIGNDTFLYKYHVRHFFDMDFMRKNLGKFEIIEIKETSGTYRHYNSHFIEAVATK
jgi:ubiquinone/menaquinone biosynthesis C-methylase UbiE